MYDNEKDLVMTAGVQAELPNTSLKDYCLNQLAYLQSLHNTPSLIFFFNCITDRCHFLNDKCTNCEQLVWLQAFTLSLCKNSSKQNWVCDSVYVVPVNGTLSVNGMQITEHIRVP